MQELELYIHIPFCVRKCDYCDFLSFPAGGHRIKEYCEALLREIQAAAIADNTEKKYRVSSIFFGGGTPSILPADQIGACMDAIRKGYDIAPDAEITIEANPGTITREKLIAWKRAGINRLSIGCQSLRDSELRALGRIHTAQEFLEGFTLARDCGFSNISIDLMSALPGQTTADWEYSLRRAAELKPEHISAYSLIIEPGTPFYEKYEEADTLRAKGGEEFELPDEESERRMYEMTEQVLSEYGFHRYEISNYAQSGNESGHNLGYWIGTPYRGFGLGASSYMNHVRFRNTDRIEQYLLDHNAGFGFHEDEELLSREDRIAEFVILGLRLTRGFQTSEFQRRFGVSFMAYYGDVFEKYQKMQLIEETDGWVRLTKKGISVSNTVMAEFL